MQILTLLFMHVGTNNIDNCYGNCFDPQPMGKAADYDAEFKIAETPLKCDLSGM